MPKTAWFERRDLGGVQMIRMVLGALALLAAAAPSAAQHTNIEAARFVDPVSVRSADLSPSGAQLAYIQRTDTHQFVVVSDVATRTARQITQVPNNEGRLNWVSWKGEGRLIISATIDMFERGRAATGSNRRAEDIEYSITRVFAINPDGSNIVQMFEGRRRVLLGGIGSTFLLDTCQASRATFCFRPGTIMAMAFGVRISRRAVSSVWLTALGTPPTTPRMAPVIR